MRSDDIFRPNKVDEQIDQLTSLSQSVDQSLNTRIVHGLSTYYEEETRSVERVWERLSHSMSEGGTNVQTIHEQREALDNTGDALLHQRKPRRLFPKKTSSTRLAMVVATLVAALLVSSLFWVLQMVHSTQIGNGQQVTASSHGIYISTSNGLTKLDIRTGKILWYTMNQNHGSYNILYQPVLLGNMVYHVEGSHILVALNVTDGKIRWSRTFNNTTVPGQMLLYASGGSLYFTSFRLGLAGAVINPEQVVLYELNPANGSIKAAYKPPHTGWHGPRVVNHILYYVAGSDLYAEQLPTEKLLWRVPLISQTGFKLKEMLIQQGKVFVIATTTDAQATFIDAFDAQTGKMLWRPSHFSQDIKTLAIADTMIYAASYSGRVYALDAHSGTLVWQQSFDTSDMLATSDILYLSYNIHATGNHSFLALRARDGAKLWQQSFSYQQDFSRLTLLNGILYSLSALNDGKADGKQVLSAFDGYNGSFRWTITLDPGVVNIA